MLGIVVNLKNNHYRRGARLLRMQTLLANGQPDYRDDVVTNALGREAARAIGALPSKQRDVAVLALLAGMSSAEIAKVLGIQASTVRTHLAQAKQRLVAKLGDGNTSKDA